MNNSDIIDFSPIKTPYLKQLKATHRARAHAAMRWRPRLLKALTMSCRLTLALRAARVSYNTVRAHERNDPEFAGQLNQAQREGAELLHDVCFKAALEGSLEPIFFQGKVVGHVRKYDSRLQIEFLRAHMPEKFKTPGQNVNANLTPNSSGVFVMDSATLAAIQKQRREALEAIRADEEARRNTAASVN
jgi:hypothetical protein